MAGEKEEQDYLWWETHTITRYAYLTLLGRGYSRSRIKYLTHLKNELLLDNNPENDHDTDLDGDGDPNNDIDGTPSLDTLKEAIDWVREKGTESLTIFLANHGMKKD